MLSIALTSIRRSVISQRSGLTSNYLSLAGFRKFSVAASTTTTTKDEFSTAAISIDVIKGNVASRERLKYSTFNDYVDSLNEPITTENISFLYDCIAHYLPQVTSDKKAVLIEKLWTKVKFWKSPSQDDYVSWLRALRECEADIAWDDVHNELENVEASLKLYEELLYLVSSFGQPEETVEVLDQIKQEEYPLTEKIFNALIVAHSRDKNVESFESVLELMGAANLTPNAETQFEMAKAYINNDLWECSEEIIDLAAFSTRQLLDLVKCSLAKEASDEWLSQLMQKLPSEVLKNREISPVVRNCLIELIHIQRRPTDVLRLLRCLPKPASVTMTENEDLYGAFVLNELLEAKEELTIIKSTCDFLISDGRNPRAAFVATEMALRRHSPHSLDMLRYLATQEALKPHYFWPLIADFQVNGEQGIVDLIAEMKALNVPVDEDTISIYLLPRLPLILKDVKSGIQLITESGVKMSELSTPLLLHLLATDRYDDFQVVLKTYPTKVDGEKFLAPLAKSVQPQSDIRSILRVLKTLMDLSKLPVNTDLNGSFLIEMTSLGRAAQLQKILTEMLKLKIKISNIAKARLEDRIKTWKGWTPEEKDSFQATLNKFATDDSNPLSTGSYLESKHPRDMDFDELENHLAELTEKQLNARGVLRKMLQMAVKEKRYERAVQLKEQCDELKMDFSPGMLASCIELYTRTEDVKLVKATWSQLETKFPNFVIDEHKTIDFATLLVKLDESEEAKNILQKRAKQKVKGGNNSNKNVWNLLTTLSERTQGTDEHLTKPFLHLLVKHNYCDYSNTVLGPLVREWLLKKDLRSAIAEYKAIAKKYRKTPLNLELLTILVAVKNGKRDFGDFTEVETMEMISDVFKAVEQVHGLASAKTSLLFATAEGGTDNQVRKILMDPNVRIDPQALQRQCEYLGKAGKTEPLFRLIKSSRGLSHNIVNEQQLWSVLMQTLAHQNNTDEAVRLFDRLLQEDEFKVSKQIADIVIDLLKRNNLELPSRLKTFDV